MTSFDGSNALRQAQRLMAKGNETLATARNEALQNELAELKELIRVLVDAIDQVRDELQWLTRNGLPAGERLPTVPVLTQMAADPCADDWGERLVIARRDSDSSADEQAHPSDSQPAKQEPAPGKLF